VPIDTRHKQEWRLQHLHFGPIPIWPDSDDQQIVVSGNPKKAEGNTSDSMMMLEI